MEIVSAIKYIDEIILSMNSNGTQIKTLEKITKKYAKEKLIFCEGEIEIL